MSDLQNLLLDYSESNFDKIVKHIIDNDYTKDDSSCKQFIRSLINYSNVRPNYSKIYAKILKEIHDKNDKSQIIPNSILHVCFIPPAQSFIASEYIPQMNFLYQCYLIGIFSFEMLDQRIKYLIDNNDYIKGIYASFIAYFAPVMFELDRKTFFSVKWFVEKRMEKNLYMSPFKQYIDYMNEEKISNLQEMINNTFQKDSLAYFIMKDDLDSVTNRTCLPSFQINDLLPNTIYCNSDIMKFRFTPLELSAYFGSINVFKFFIEQSADFERNSNLIAYAIAGGNMEILRILQQRECNFESSLSFAAKYHRFEIFQWLVDVCGQQINNDILLTCCTVNNLPCLQYCFEIEDGNFIQTIPDYSIDSLIKEAVKFGSLDVFNYLISFPHEKIEFATSVIFRQPHMVKLLLDRGDVNFDTKFINGTTLEKAATCGDVDIIKLIVESGKYEISDQTLINLYGAAKYYTDILAMDYFREVFKQRNIPEPK